MIHEVVQAVADAGRAIESIRVSGYAVDQKGEAGPVTEADRAADRLLRHRLLGLRPCGWLSEETADSAERLSQPALWVVDPLDGTKEFVAGLPEYSVAVALVENGQPVLGVVHNPQTGEMFWATEGGGAFRDGERLWVAEGDAMLASRSEIARGEFVPFISGWDVTHVGSIEYKLALIASGKGSVTLSRGPKWEWDVCAGSLLVAEAGGRVSDVFGGPLVFNQPFPKVKGILAGAPQAYARAATAIAVLGASDRMREMSG